MPDWATGWAIYTFTLGLAFYCGVLSTKVSGLKENIQELKIDIKDDLAKLHEEIEAVRQAVGTRNINGKH